MLLYALIICLSVYAVIVLLLVVGVHRETSRRDKTEDRPFISVVIPVRNEALNLRQCLESVLHQTYPSLQYEVILVNDNSTDGTASIAADMAARYPMLKVLDVPEHPDRIGKLVALDAGIRISNAPLIVLTDGDITVQPTWLEQLVRHMPVNVGIAGGLTLPTGDSIVARMQTLDWAFLLGISCGTIGLRLPISIIANNFAIRRAAHDEVGGFATVRNTVDDDFLMFKSVVETTGWGYRFILHPDCVNTTLPCPTLKEAMRQKHRWGRGSFSLNLIGLTLILTALLTHFLIVAQATTSLPAAAACLAAKCLLDASFIGFVLGKVRRVGLLRHFLWFELFYFMYVLILPAWILFVRDVEWKGRVYADAS